MSDVVFRSSIAGFNKEDVLNYIENMKKEQEKQKDILSASAVELSNAFKKINELENQLNIYKQTADELRLENSQYVSIINKDSGRDIIIESNFDENTDIDINVDVIKLNAENQALKIKINELKNECNKYFQNKKHFESLITDAYIYSEGILDEAKAKAEQIVKGTQCTVEYAADDIRDFSVYVNNISQGFSEIVSQLTDDIKYITNNLMTLAKGFKDNINEKNDDENGDINMYINNDEKDFLSQEPITKNEETNNDDIVSYIEEPENIILENNESEYVQAEEDTQSDSDDTQELIPDISDAYIEADTYEDDSIEQEAEEQNIDELIGEYADNEPGETSDNTQTYDVNSQRSEENSDEVSANFISSEPIGQFRMDSKPEKPLEPIVQLDEGFNLQNYYNPLDPDATPLAQPGMPQESKDYITPLQSGSDYSSLFEFDDTNDTGDNTLPTLSTDEQFKDIINEYAEGMTDENYNSIPYAESNNENSKTEDGAIASKKVDFVIDEPKMIDPNNIYKPVEDSSGKTRFGKIKIKIKKNK